MKFILLSSIRGKSPLVDDANKKIVSTLEAENHKIFHEHVTNITQQDLDKFSDEEHVKFHKKILNNIKQSDIVIAQCTQQSLSVGYLISYALELNKPTLIFYHESSTRPNLFPTLNFSDLLLMAKYKTNEELAALLKEYIEYASEKMDVRFNFFISPSIGNYLDWISKEKKIPRSVYLRTLIEKDMIENQEYNE